MTTTHFDLMDQCAEIGLRKDTASLPVLFTALAHDDWRVRYAAAVALGDMPTPAAVAPLLSALAIEDAAPLYSQPELPAGGSAGSSGVVTPEFPAGTTPDQIEAWRRRGRVKQAVCLALGAIGDGSPGVLAVLHRYAVDSGEDYLVRASSCKALGQIGSPASRAVLSVASKDEEWCTSKEAMKGLECIDSVSRR